MSDVIRIKRRVTGVAGAPASLANAELAYNEVDHCLYYGEGTGGAGGSASVIPVIGGQGLLASAALTGVPTTPTAAAGTNTTQVASTAFVTGAVNATMPAHTYQGNNTGSPAAPINVTAAQLLTDIAAAPLASPTFTGVPAAPTPANGTNTTQIATTAYVLATRLDQFAAPTVDVAWNSHKITGLLDPTNPQDAATKNYVDVTVQGLQIKPTARLATTGALPANTYANGTAGVGATLTATANGALSVDGVAVAVGDIILVKNEATASHNGLYTVTATGGAAAPYALTRHADMDAATDYSGAFIPVAGAGATLANTLWLANPSTPVTVGTTSIPFTQLNAATTYTAGNGISIAANVVAAVGTANRDTVGGGTIDIDAAYVGQTSIVTLGTITTGTWNGTTIAVNKGGSGATTLTGYLKGNGTAAFTGSATIPNTDITGLGTMSTQAASAVAITGGSIDGVTLDCGSF
jgi:hypothetical protein